MKWNGAENHVNVLYSPGSPLTWDTRFETPLSNLALAKDQEGKMNWDNMNTIERIHLLPSRPKVCYKNVTQYKI